MSHVDKKASLKLGFRDLSGRQAAGAGICQSPAYPGTPEGSVDLHQMAQEVSLFANPGSLSCRPGSEHELRISLMKSMGIEYLL